MDEVYDDLENFTEEATNAELREENKNLKIKLEEYATALQQLQKEFDTLLMEHQKLELNYSSLLKTARSEIERKTQTITKLNIEKDELVLNSIQNRNTPYNRRKPSTNEPKNREGPSFRNASQIQYNSDNHIKPSHLNQVPNERREQNYGMSADFNNLQRNKHTRHQDIVNRSVVNPNINTARENEVKENVIVKDEHRSRARITGRRKSMPVLGMDSKFSSDEDEVTSSGSSKFVPRELENTYPDKPSMEHKVFVHNDYKPETRSRHHKHDSYKHRNRDNQQHKRNQSSHRRRSPDRKKASPERRRVSSDRIKASPERRRPSPEKRIASQDRNRKDVHDYSAEFYKRQEYDRHKRLASPPKDKYHDYKHKSRDSHHFNERQVEFEKYKSRSKDKYTTKHKMIHDYEEPSSKRMRVDSYPKHEEDRWRVEKQISPASFEMDSLHMSCQSPDQNYFEAHPSHQTREIKLTASTLLDDPRLTSKKYALKNQDGIAKLSTVDSTNIDVKVIDTSGWEIIKTVKMPDALLTKPINPDLPSVSLLQRPMTSGTPSTSLQKPMFSDTSDKSLLKPKSEMPQAFIQKPASSRLSDLVSSDMPETLQKSPKIPDNQLLTDPISIHESKSTDMPDILNQKPIAGDESISEAPTQNPISNDDLIKEIYMDIENPISNMSMETVSDTYDFDKDFNNSGQNTSVKNPQELIRKDEVELPNVKTVAKKPSNSKISKKSIVSSDECNNQKPNPKQKNKNTESKTTDKTNKKSSEDLSLNESKLPSKHCSSDFQNYISAKEIIAGDLELSDENSDNTDMPIIKQNPIYKDKQDIEMKDGLDSNKKDKSKSFELKIDFDEANIGEKTDDIMLDIRKCKPKKKSLKLKETKELRGNKDTLKSMDKLVKKTEATQELCENADTSLSIDQLVKIKEDITKELAEKAIPDKPIKKKDTKIKALSKSKEAAVTIDKTVKKKEIQPKGLIEIKDTDKPGPVKKKDNKPKEQPEKKETVSVEKPLKKKDIKTKETVEPTNAIPINKTAKKKCIIQESSSNIEKEIINIAVKKDDEYKTKDNKFNELFGDSSSLVSPEDLGLVPTVVAPPENYIAMFEDAQDALDMNSIRASITTASTKNTNDSESKAQTNFSINSENKKPLIPVEPTYNQMQGLAQTEPVSNSSINQTMYQNLQPEFSQDSNIVKTVIISSGIQPQCNLEATETYPITSDNKDLHVMQCVKPSVLQDIALQALATSTPQKIWHQNVQAVESISVTRCESREGSITETPVTATSSTNVTHTNSADEPDVTIFVKRRRKVLRKK